MWVMTYNIHEWKGIDGQVDWGRIVDVIGESRADIVALQEVVDPLEDRHPLAEITSALDMDVARHGRHAILSRFPIVSQQPHVMPRHGGGTEVRLLEGRLTLAEKQTLTVYAVHLWWSSEVTRLGQTEAVLEHIARNGEHPHILLGDFNSIAPGDPALPHLYVDDPHVEAPFSTRDERLASELPNLYVYDSDARGSAGSLVPGPKYDVISRVESAGYVDAFRTVGRGERGTCTWLVPETQIRVDYIFVPLALQAHLAECWRFDTGLARLASDHYPVLADLSLVRPAQA